MHFIFFSLLIIFSPIPYGKVTLTDKGFVSDFGMERILFFASIKKQILLYIQVKISKV